MSTPLQQEYAEFLRHEPSTQEVRRRSEVAVQQLKFTPLISIVVPVFKPSASLYEETLASATNQTYSEWELILVHDGPQPPEIVTISQRHAESDKRIRIVEREEQGGISAATNAGASAANGEFIAFLDHDDLLRPHALERMVSAMQSWTRPPDMVYSDHDKIDTEGNRFEPEFKPDWSPETLLSYCYVGHFKMIRREMYEKLSGMRSSFDSVQDYDLFLRLAEQTNSVAHVPEILYHWRSVPGSTAWSANDKPKALTLGQKAVQEALIRRRKRGTVTMPNFATEHNIGVYEILYRPEEFTEHVTIVIPTKDRIDLLKPCIESIYLHTQYPHYDILVINNNSTEAETARYLASANIHHVDIQTDTFNFSKLMNVAREHAEGDYLLLLNNDTEALHDGWLTTMMGSMLLHGNIGAVGAKLLFNDNTVQHAGVVLGPNNTTAAHANYRVQNGESGYANSLRSMRNYSVVTGACLLTSVEAYDKVGGFNETQFPVSYNDVDYCLKLLAADYRVVYTPNAVLRHHESETRKHDHSFAVEYNARAQIRSMWQPLLLRDPYYNPNFSLQDGCFHIRKRPRGKHILFATHNLEYQGASLFLYELTKELMRRDYHVEVTAPYGGPLQERYFSSGIPLHIREEYDSHPVELLNKSRYDILFFNTITTYELLEKIDTRAHPLIWCIHESEKDTYMEWMPDLKEHMFSEVSDMLFVSEATRNVYGDLPQCHVHMIHNGTDIDAIDTYAAKHSRSQIREELRIPADTFVITTIGTICPRKGQLELIEACRELLRNESRPVIIQIIGNFGSDSYEEKIRTLLENESWRHRVRIIPSNDDIHRYYMASDVLVCNSLIESFPRVTLEAMAWRLPIVATNVFGIPEQIDHGTEGLLVPPGQPEQLRKAIETIRDDAALVKQLTNNARRRVEREFSFSTMVDRYEELFYDIANR